MSSICFSHLLGDGERDLLDLVPDLDLGLGGAPLGLAGLLDDDLLLGDLDLLAGVLVLPLLAGVLVLALTLGGGDGDAELRGSLYLPLLTPAFTMPVRDLVDLLLLPGGGGDTPMTGVLDLLPALALRAAC